MNKVDVFSRAVVGAALLFSVTNSDADQLVPLDNASITSYSAQDKTTQGSFVVSADGTEIEVTGNRWLAVPFNYTITPNTVVEFEVEVGTEPEIAAIGFDENLNYSDTKRAFGISGTQTWGGALNLDSEFQYDHTEAGWQTYAVHVGLFYTGDINHFVVINDHDGQPRDGVVRWRNIRIYEYFPSGSPRLDLYNSYSNQDKPNQGYVEIDVDDADIGLFGNRWVKMLFPYTVTEETVLEFDFRSTEEAEIHALGFDSDNDLGNDAEFFQLFGTQNWAAAFQVRDSINYDPLDEWKHYKIPVGLIFQGDVQYMIFTNDNDATPGGGNSLFRHVQIYESPPDGSIASEYYSGVTGQDKPTQGTTVSDQAAGTIEMTGNRWVYIPISYDITPDTLLEFDFRSDEEGEVHGIGVDEDEYWNNSMRIFHIYGTQPTPTQFIMGELYDDDAPAWKSYSIPVGQYYTGHMTRLYLVNDDDAPPAIGHSIFRNIRLREPGTPDDSDGDGLPDAWELQYFGDLSMDGAGDPDMDGANNSTEYLAGNDPTDFFNGITPVLTITGGNSQEGEAGTLLTEPLMIMVSRPDTTPWENAPVLFSSIDGGLQSLDGTVVDASDLTVRADSSGFSAVRFSIPSNAPAGLGNLVALASAEAITFSFEVLGPNVGPSLAISSPVEGARYPDGDPISATVVPTDPDGTVVRLRLFVNGTLAADIDTSASQNFGPVALGETNSGWNTLVAEVSDDDGATSIAATHFYITPATSEQVALGMIGGGILVPVESDAEVSVASPVAQPSVYAGSISTVDGAEITVAGNPGWNANRFADGLHAVTVLDGNLAGAVLVIETSGANSLTTSAGTDLSDMSLGDRIRIVPIWTIQRLAPIGETIEIEVDGSTPGTHVLLEDALTVGVDKPALAEYFLDATGWHEIGTPGTVAAPVPLEIPAVLTLANPLNAPAKIFAPVGDIYDFPIVSYLVADSSSAAETPVGVVTSAPISLNQSGLLASGVSNEFRRSVDTVTVSTANGSRIFFIENGNWREIGAGSADVGDEEVLFPGSTISVYMDPGGPFTSWLQWPRIR